MVRVPETSFGVLLRALREAAGLSQEELAERAGLSSHAVSALERGTRTRPYPHTVRALAEALGASDDDRAALIAAVPSRKGEAAARPGAEPAAPAPGRGRALPQPPAGMVGREDDERQVRDLLAGHRIVTLTGTGGVGKTSLAVAVAHGVLDRYADGAAFVELARVREVEGVLPAIADAVDLSLPPGVDPLDALTEHLRGQQLLLVLDNLEHLLRIAVDGSRPRGAAPHVAALVAGAPDLTVLATSRAPLRVRGEVETPVAPLAVPVAADDRSPALRLLLERAGAVSPGWGTDPDDAEVVAEICRRLEGIPLAVELVAARCRLLDPASLLDRLDQALLAGGRDHPDRQRTMRATLDWSYGLLTGEEQAMLRVLSVFVGGFRLDDLEEVVALFGGVGEEDVLCVLEALVEQSLVVNVDTAGVRRHRLLEPVAQYARSRLEEAGEAARAETAHAAHYLAVAEAAAPAYLDGRQVDALLRVDAEHPNLTAAVERSLAAGDPATAGRLAWALWLYWWLRGHLAEGRRLSEAALEHDLPDAVRPRAELAAATMTFALDDVRAARGWWLAAREHAGEDHVAMTNAVAGIGLAHLAHGELAEAADRFAECRPHAERAGEEGEWTWALSWIWSGTIRLLSGDPDRAVEEIERGLASARRRGDRLSSYIALYNLSQVELARGAHDRAREHLVEGARLSLETGDHANLAYLLDATAVLAAASGLHARVPLLLGAAQALREAIGSHGYGYYRPDPVAIRAAAEEARGHLGQDRYDDVLDRGRGLSPSAAAELVAAEPRVVP